MVEKLSDHKYEYLETMLYNSYAQHWLTEQMMEKIMSVLIWSFQRTTRKCRTLHLKISMLRKAPYTLVLNHLLLPMILLAI